MQIHSGVLAIVLSLCAIEAMAADRAAITLTVHIEGKPLSNFELEYRDDDLRSHRVVTNADGVARIEWDVHTPEWNLRSASSDFVLRNLERDGHRWHVDVVRSAKWRLRNRSRVCDAWRLVIDIPVGALPSESAAEYDEWYASLNEAEIQNCVLLASIEAQLDSKAPWYFYEFKGRPKACVNGLYGAEGDWTAWYRDLLAEATGASPGKCVADWERWWSAKGYPAIPNRVVPHEQRSQ